MAETERKGWKKVGGEVLLTIDKWSAIGMLAFGAITLNLAAAAYGGANLGANALLRNKFESKSKPQNGHA
ncbi:MAG: hypothetical protein ABIO02_04945 [Patescibacteria group bacterium]